MHDCGESVYDFQIDNLYRGISQMDKRAIIVWAIIGIIAGYLASVVLGGNGLIRYLITGLLGAFVGGFLAQVFNIRINLGHYLLDQIAIATMGAIVVVIVTGILF